MINEEIFKKKCEVRGLTCQFGTGVIYVGSGISNWRIFHNGSSITKVMHENYRGYSKNNNFKSGYHEQKLWNFKINNVLNYIEKHDSSFFSKKSDYNKMFSRANQRLKIA